MCIKLERKKEKQNLKWLCFLSEVWNFTSIKPISNKIYFIVWSAVNRIWSDRCVLKKNRDSWNCRGPVVWTNRIVNCPSFCKMQEIEKKKKSF